METFKEKYQKKAGHSNRCRITQYNFAQKHFASLAKVRDNPEEVNYAHNLNVLALRALERGQKSEDHMEGYKKAAIDFARYAQDSVERFELTKLLKDDPRDEDLLKKMQDVMTDLADAYANIVANPVVDDAEKKELRKAYEAVIDEMFN